jgi:hypothetical protein
VAKAELKTKPQKQTVAAFLKTLDNDARRKDAKIIDKMMQAITGCKGVVWGTSIVGYDSYHYVYASGREADWMITGFSPRKANLVLYIMSGFAQYEELMAKLGRYKTGKACLYINSLDQVDLKVLEKLITASVKMMRKKYAAA